jgi:hypothetical protein
MIKVYEIKVLPEIQGKVVEMKLEIEENTR